MSVLAGIVAIELPASAAGQGASSASPFPSDALPVLVDSSRCRILRSSIVAQNALYSSLLRRIGAGATTVDLATRAYEDERSLRDAAGIPTSAKRKHHEIVISHQLQELRLMRQIAASSALDAFTRRMAANEGSFTNNCHRPQGRP